MKRIFLFYASSRKRLCWLPSLRVCLGHLLFQRQLHWGLHRFHILQHTHFNVRNTCLSLYLLWAILWLSASPSASQFFHSFPASLATLHHGRETLIRVIVLTHIRHPSTALGYSIRGTLALSLCDHNRSQTHKPHKHSVSRNSHR